MLVQWARRICACDLPAYKTWGAARVASYFAGGLSESTLVQFEAVQFDRSRTMLEADVGISEWTNTLVGFTGILKQR